MKIIAVLIALILAILPASAMSNVNGTITFNETDVITFIEVSKMAGDASARLEASKLMYDRGMVSLSDHRDNIQAGNKMIRLYNNMIGMLFNFSISNDLKIAEFSI